MLRQYVRNWRITTIRNMSDHEPAYPLVSGSFPKRPFPYLYLSSSSTVKAHPKPLNLWFLQIVPWIVFCEPKWSIPCTFEKQTIYFWNHAIKMNSKVPTRTEFLSHETKISDVFRMINTPPISFIIHLSFHSLKRPLKDVHTIFPSQRTPFIVKTEVTCCTVTYSRTCNLQHVGCWILIGWTFTHSRQWMEITLYTTILCVN